MLLYVSLMPEGYDTDMTVTDMLTREKFTGLNTQYNDPRNSLTSYILHRWY